MDKLLDLHILNILGSLELKKITSSDISKVINASKSKGHSAKTTLHIYTILYSIFQSASDFYKLKIPNPVLRRFHRPKVPKKKAPFMTPLQTWAFLDYVIGSPYAVGIWCMALSALRISEAIPRKWSDFDFENDQISVFTIHQREVGIQEYTKSGDQVYVPMPARLKEFLLEHRRPDDEYIMPNKNGEMMDYYNFRRYFRNVCKKLKLPIRSVHGLRHSCTEIWVNVGATAEDLRRLLNHASLDSTEGYIHRTNDRLRELSKKIS